MAVQVRLSGEWVGHDEGESVRVAEGHLFVMRPASDGRGQGCVAVYSPGIWKRAVVKSDKER